MSGNDVMLTERDRLLLERLDTFRVLDREMASAVGGFNSVTRANVRLLKLTRAGLLNRIFLGSRTGAARAAYLLSKKGATVASAQHALVQRHRDELVVADPFIEHQLAINSIRIQLDEQPIPARTLKWKNGNEPISQAVPLVPDGCLQLGDGSGVHTVFLEVDMGTEALKVWAKKVELYLRLASSGEFQKLFGQERFRVAVAVFSERRLDTLRRTTAKQTEKLFWFSTLEAIKREGMFGAHWLRPVGSDTTSLL